MERIGSRLTQNASTMILYPILGMIGGLLLGALRTRIGRLDSFSSIELVVKWGFLGALFGAVAIVLVPVLAKKNVSSVRRLLGVIGVAAVLLWFVISLLRDLTTSGVLR